MKTMKIVLVAGALVIAGSQAAWAAEAAAPEIAAPAATQTVYVCSKEGCTMEAPGKCPICGAELEAKEMTASDAQVALDKWKDEIRHRR